MFHVGAPAWEEARARDQFPGTGPVLNEIGRGRVAYIPEIKPAIEKPMGARMTSQYWKLPVNWREVVETVRWAARGDFSLQVNAPLTVIAEPMVQRQTKKLLVHFVNYNVAATPEVSNLDVKFQLPAGASVAKVTLLSPDRADVVTLPHNSMGGVLAFTVPRLATYDLTVIQLK